MSDIKPLFSGEMQLAGWSQTHNGGCKVSFWLPGDEEMEPFKGLTARKGNHAGHRFAVVMVEIDDNEMPIDHTEDVLDMVPRAINVVFGDETTAVRPNGAAFNGEPGHGDQSACLEVKPTFRSPNHPAFPMVDQLVDANKTIGFGEAAANLAIEKSRPKNETVPTYKGGELAKWAGILCNDPKFWRFFHDGYREDIRIDTEEICKFAIYEHCGIRSRAELDHNKDAAQSFREVMANFDKWKGVQKWKEGQK